ncbi:MAG: hypothetical protein WCO16_03775 [bacterium]
MHELPNQQFEKAQQFHEKLEELKTVADGMGKGIEPGIIEACAALNLLGFMTEQSCEGHLDWGEPTPWVRISHTDEPKWKWEGEQLAYEIIAEKYGVKLEDLHRDPTDEQWKEIDPGISDVEILEYTAWKDLLLEDANRAKALIDEFNSGRDTPIESRVQFSSGPQSFYIEAGNDSGNKGIKSRLAVVRTTEELEPLLQARQKEMVDFTEFLKGKWLNG